MTEITTNQEALENSAIAGMNKAAKTAFSPGAIEQDAIPAGAGCAGRTETARRTGTETKFPGNLLLNNAENHERKITSKNPCGKAATGKNAGLHIPRAVIEATGIMKDEGYTVWMSTDPTSVFDLLGCRAPSMIHVRVVRPTEPIRNARDVRDVYEAVIQEIEPCWHSEADNLQFWVFSREKGLIRYRVFDWGIWNEETMLKFVKNQQNFQPESESARKK